MENTYVSEYWTKEMIELAATNGTFLPSDSGYEKLVDLDGLEARKFLENKGFKVVENRDIGRNGVAITECGIYLSTNGYIHR